MDIAVLAEPPDTQDGTSLNRPSSFFIRALEPVLVLLTLSLGIINLWQARYSMDPDGMSYLDVGRSFFHRDWGNAMNA